MTSWKDGPIKLQGFGRLGLILIELFFCQAMATGSTFFFGDCQVFLMLLLPTSFETYFKMPRKNWK